MVGGVKKKNMNLFKTNTSEDYYERTCIYHVNRGRKEPTKNT